MSGSRGGFRWAVVGITWFAYMSAYLVRTAVAPLSPFIIAGLSLSKFEVGLLVSASALGYMAFQLPAGWLVDRVGVRKMLFVGPFVAGTFVAGMYLAGSFSMALAVMVLAGFGCGCFPTVATKAVLHWFPLRERATAIGVNQTSLNVAGVLTASLLPTVALLYDWRVAFIPVALIPIAASFAAYGLYREPPGAAEKNGNGRGTSWDAVRSVVFNRNIVLVATACMGLCVCEFAFTGYLVVFLTEVTGVSVTIAGGYLAAANLGGAVGKPFFGFLSDRVFGGSRRKPLLVVAILIFVLTLAMQTVSASTPAPILLGVIVLFGFTAIGWGGMNLVLASEFAGKENAGLAVGYAATISLIGNLAGPPIFGWMADASGSYSMSWYLMTVSAVLAIILLFFIQESKRKAG